MIDTDHITGVCIVEETQEQNSVDNSVKIHSVNIIKVAVQVRSIY